jgi:hypothetical protein
MEKMTDEYAINVLESYISNESFVYPLEEIRKAIKIAIKSIKELNRYKQVYMINNEADIKEAFDRGYLECLIRQCNNIEHERKQKELEMQYLNIANK